MKSNVITIFYMVIRSAQFNSQQYFKVKQQNWCINGNGNSYLHLPLYDCLGGGLNSVAGGQFLCHCRRHFRCKVDFHWLLRPQSYTCGSPQTAPALSLRLHYPVFLAGAQAFADYCCLSCPPHSHYSDSLICFSPISDHHLKFSAVFNIFREAQMPVHCLWFVGLLCLDNYESHY